MKLQKLIFVFILFSTTLVMAQEEATEQHPLLTDKFHFEVGTFFPTKSIDIEVNGDSSNGNFAFGEIFGLESSQTTFLFSFDWRFAKKWKVAFEYFGINNSNTRTLNKDVTWEDFTLEQGTNIKGGVDFRIYRIYFGRIFTQGQKHQFGGGLGVHLMNTRASIEGNVLTNLGDVVFETSRKTITIPLPNLGLWYYYTPIPKLALIARVDFFTLSINEFSGTLWNVTPQANYQVFENFGVGLSYRYVNVGAKYETSNWDGGVDITFHGPSIVITANL